MKIDQFLRHHGITGNPFSEEDAQTDTIFKRGCLWKIHHPAWDKYFGSPADPSTALVFGEKGSGKTALRLQSEAEFEAYNDAHPRERVFVVSYDDFNPFLDHFREAVHARDAGEALTKFRLQDHMDAILALSVTKLVDQLTSERVDLSPLSLDQRRDLLLLSALYDQSTGVSIEQRWSRLRRRSGFRPLWSRRDLQVGVGTTVIVVALTLLFRSLLNWSVWPWVLGAIVAGWVYWIWRLGRADWFARNSQRNPHPRPRPFGVALGVALVQTRGTRRSTSAGDQGRRGGALRTLTQVPRRSSHARLSRHRRLDRPR